MIKYILRTLPTQYRIFFFKTTKTYKTKMSNKRVFDTVQFWESILVPSDGKYQPSNSWHQCGFRLMHESDFWQEEFRHTIPFHDWPTDGSDYAFVIGIKRKYHKYQQRSIALNGIDYIHSLDRRTILINAIKFEYVIEFSNEAKVKTLFEMVYRQIPCFYWDLIITNVQHNNFCLLNRNYTNPKYDMVAEPEEEYDDDSNIVILPASYPKQVGQSTSTCPIIEIPPPPTLYKKQNNNDNRSDESIDADWEMIDLNDDDLDNESIEVQPPLPFYYESSDDEISPSGLLSCFKNILI